MTDKKTEALKLALEALEEAQAYASSESFSPSMTNELAIRAAHLRLALEQPQTPDDLLRQSEREGWRYAKECEAEVKRLRQALEQEPWDTTDMAFRPSWLRDEDREILEAVRRELDRGNQDGNAPGHGHEVPGIWDSDNGARAGKPCAWCLTWKKFTTIIDREATLKDKKK